MLVPQQSDFYGPDALPDTQPTASEAEGQLLAVTYLQFEIRTRFLHFALGRARRNVLWPRRCICLCVSVCVRRRMSTLLQGTGFNFGEWYGVLPSCTLLGGFAIGARVSLIWQHTRLMRNVSEDADVLAVWVVVHSQLMAHIV